MAGPPQSHEAGGFIQPTLPSPPSSSATSHSAPVLPQPRSSPLKAGGTKERDLINYVEQKLLAISRRYENRFNAELGVVSLDVGGRGYEGFQEQARDLGALIDVLWTSGTREIKIKSFSGVPDI